jgi:rod shape-determining protein MreD
MNRFQRRDRIRTAWVLGAVFLSAMFDGQISPHIGVFGAEIRAMAVTIVVIALTLGSPYAAFAGVAGGLLEDVLYGQAIGVYALPLMLLGHVVSFIRAQFYPNSTWLIFLVSLGAAAFNEAAVFVLYRIAYGVWWTAPFRSVVVADILLTAIPATIIQRVIVGRIERMKHRA